MPTATQHRSVDADFAGEILAELYAYGRKRRWLARLLWATVGILGGHRFYLGRPLTALLMLVSLGGGLLWWLIDGFLLAGMLRAHDEEQERRRAAGLPPLELAFMPPLWRDALERPPLWTLRWQDADRTRRAGRLAADVAVLLIAGYALARVAVAADVFEAILAVLVLVVLTAAGASVGRVGHLPVVRGLIRWSHRLRLFYYYTPPGGALSLLFRPVTGAVLAPFRRRARAEVRLYLQLGGVFTLLFLLLDFGGAVLAPIVGSGRLPDVSALIGLWIVEATSTFVVIYAFATPIGAVLTKYLLMMRTHRLPRLLSALVVAAMAAGLLH